MSDSSVNGSEEIRAVQYLRAAAAILVVFSHTGVYTEQFYWPTPRAFGAAGVDLFFVISGFIMMVVTAQRPTTPGEFLARRLIRVAPLYWLFTLAILAVCLVWPAAMLHNLVTFDHVARSLLFIPHFNPLESNYTPFFKLGWTLNYEIYFYIVFAALLVLPSIRLRLVTLAFLFSTAAAFYLAFLPADPFPHIYCNPIILEFVIGAAVGYLFLQKKMAKIAPRYAAMLIGGGSFVIVVMFDADDFTRVQTGIASAALLLGLLAKEAHGRLPRSPMLMLLGDASYSIYLAHPLVLTLARVAARALHVPVDQPLIGMAAVVSTLSLSIVAGVLTHLFIEKPMLAFLRRRLLRRAAKPAVVAAPALPLVSTRHDRRADAAALLFCALGVAAFAFAGKSLAAETKRAAQAPARLVHEEDFSRAAALDENFWSYEIGFIRNREEQYYRPSNVFVADGALVLEGRAEGVVNARYDRASNDWTRSTLCAEFTSGSIVSRRSMRYGSVEIVARAPKGAGTWPAIWMLGGEDGAPYREIDILEAVGKHPDIVFTSAHAGPTLDELTNWSAETNVPALSTQWHRLSAGLERRDHRRLDRRPASARRDAARSRRSAAQADAHSHQSRARRLLGRTHRQERDAGALRDQIDPRLFQRDLTRRPRVFPCFRKHEKALGFCFDAFPTPNRRPLRLETLSQIGVDHGVRRRRRGDARPGLIAAQHAPEAPFQRQSRRALDGDEAVIGLAVLDIEELPGPFIGPGLLGAAQDHRADGGAILGVLRGDDLGAELAGLAIIEAELHAAFRPQPDSARILGRGPGGRARGQRRRRQKRAGRWRENIAGERARHVDPPSALEKEDRRSSCRNLRPLADSAAREDEERHRQRAERGERLLQSAPEHDRLARVGAGPRRRSARECGY